MSERDILIRTIIGEAAGEGPEGWAAVAHVVRNRAMDGRWPNSVSDVSLQDQQFSAWNKGAGGNALVDRYGPGDDLYEQVGAVVDQVLSGALADNTGGATHYYSPRGMDKLVEDGDQSNRIPRWLQDETERRGGGTVTIGGHIFTGRAEGTPDDIVASANNTAPTGTRMAKEGVQSIDPETSQRLYDLYTSGQMSPQQRADYEADIASGVLPTPQGFTLQPVVAQVDEGQASTLYNAFIDGRMNEQQQADYIADVRSGGLTSPATASQLDSFASAMRNLTPPPDMPNVAAPEVVDTRGQMDLTRRTAADAGGDLAAQAFSGLTGDGPSPTAAMAPNAPAIVQKAGDGALTLLGGLGAVGGGVAGLVGDVAEFAGVPRAPQLARDLAAIPESLAGSPMTLGASARSQVTNAARNTPEAPQQRAIPQVDHTRPIARPQPVAAMSETDAQNLAPLIGEAAKNNRGARQQLAEMAEINPEGLAAADRVGIEAPADVFADNPQIQQAVGAVRAVNGSDAAAEWESTFVNAQARAAEIIADEGASPSLAAASERVQESLTTSIDTLRRDAGVIYDEIRDQIPTGTRLAPNESVKAINEVIDELGGVESLPAPVRRLFNAVTSDQGMTYGRLMQERSQIGRAIARSQGPYADADSRTLNRLYAALGEDQSRFVGVEVGEEAAARLGNANALWSEAKDLEDRLVSAFGKDLEGSVANRLRTAITNASRGDAAGLNRILNVVPENLQKEALLSGISEVATANSGQGGFSFANYARVYRGLRENEPIYGRVAGVLGDDTANMMRDLYEVSVRMDRAAQRVSVTGKSNQAILFADGLMGRFLDSTVGKSVRGVAASAAGSAVGGPVLGGIAAVGASSGRLARGRQRAAGAMFQSEAFQQMAREAVTKGRVSEGTVQRLQRDPAYRRWAGAAGVPDDWLLETVARAAATPQEEMQE